MAIVAKEEQRVFWEMFEEALMQNGEPFKILHDKKGEPTFWAVVNKRRILFDLGLSLDFTVRNKNLKIQVYIRNNIPLYNYLYSKKGEIEENLGFKPVWNDRCQKPDTRRIEYNIQFIPGNREDYERVIEEALPITEKFRKVFGKYIPNLFDICDKI